MSPLRSPILLCNGKANFFIDQKVLLITVLLVAAQVLLKIKVSIEPCLVSVVVLMGCCSGTGEYEAAKITVFSLQKTRLHHCYYYTYINKTLIYRSHYSKHYIQVANLPLSSSIYLEETVSLSLPR